MSAKERVAIIGSGNWGSACAILVGRNVIKHSERFEKDVKMWVFDEQVNGKSIVDIINETHENVKYLPGRHIPDNIVATRDLQEVVKDATALVFVMPHQFIHRTCERIKGHLHPQAKAISLTKGTDVTDGKVKIFPDVIESALGCSISALSGANIADEIADGAYSETTIGYRNLKDGEMWKDLFATERFRVDLVDDVIGVSLCGALKNIVALAAGFTEGLGWGDNSKAAVMRQGLVEMKRFSQDFFPDVKSETFLEHSCGVADVITSCLGGRNFRVARAFVGSGKTIQELEAEMLNGQKLQGTETAREVHEFLLHKSRVEDYPLFNAVYSISFEGYPPEAILDLI